MSWEQALLDLFDDLETQAAGLAGSAREADAADLARAEYAEVTWAERLHGALGRDVRIEAAGQTKVAGRLERVGRGCAAVRATDVPRVLHLVNVDHLTSLVTHSLRADAESTQPVTSRLGFASAVRHLAEEVDDVALRLVDGRRLTGALARVGADFLEVAPDVGAADGVLLVPMTAVVTLAPA